MEIRKTLTYMPKEGHWLHNFSPDSHNEIHKVSVGSLTITELLLPGSPCELHPFNGHQGAGPSCLQRPARSEATVLEALPCGTATSAQNAYCK